MNGGRPGEGNPHGECVCYAEGTDSPGLPAAPAVWERGR
jgi:hypothetical protein